nr:MAG TPA: hypothetical protein [Caudoviricetes sp.]
MWPLSFVNGSSFEVPSCISAIICMSANLNLEVVYGNRALLLSSL